MLGETEQANQLLEEAMQFSEPHVLILRKKIYTMLPSPMQRVARSLYIVLRHPARISAELTLVQQRLLDRYKLNDLNQVYSEDWFANRKEGAWYQDIRHFCEIAWEQFNPTSVADVGCGPGIYLKCFRELGSEATLGLEGSTNALRQATVPDIILHDLREPFRHSQQYDLVLCIEVAEHIHSKYSAVLVGTIAGLCKPGGHVIFTAAPPGQGGIHHINLQPKTYWIDRFLSMGLSYSKELSEQLSNRLSFKVLSWIRDNLMIFVKSSTSHEHEAIGISHHNHI